MALGGNNDYTVTVGAGGAGFAPPAGTIGNDGNDSSFSGPDIQTFTSGGGGGGNLFACSPTPKKGGRT